VPVFLCKLIWRLRGKRLVRLHLIGQDGSLEGILLGRFGAHYVLITASYLEDKDRTFTLDGHVEVPAERVLFVQVLAKDGR
jgi:hypothetical protein